ncbi:MAG: hypothetical protein IPI43_34265 [Sandaracinaceae bacterium]|nr:hypothetical protein [Sandaracinaceae bacterium]MBK7779130.1 hypothetical protein [Sandaracinaceae bacterium]
MTKLPSLLTTCGAAAFALFATVLPTVASANCGWIDGGDQRAPADPGRGVNDWRQHFTAGQANAANVPEWVGSRFDTLRGCMSRENFARLYADASLRIARAGAQAGWVKCPDRAAPPNDGGRGIRTFRPHYDHALDAGRAAGVSAFIRQRLADLRTRISADEYARLYADLSILTVHYAGMD